MVVLGGLDFSLEEPPPRPLTMTQLRAQILGREIAEWDAIEARLQAGDGDEEDDDVTDA